MTHTIAVTGGRHYRDKARVKEVLDGIHDQHPIDILLEGGAPGADTLCRRWAEDRGLECITFQADWSKYGRGAGPIRNRQILDHAPDLLVAFPGGRGTADMVRQARERNIAILEVL